MIQEILDIIYPVRCPICAEIVLPKGELICSCCKEALPYVEEPKCMKCGKPMEQPEKEYCSDCERKSYHYDKGFAIWHYNEDLKRSISQFKYYSKKEYAKFYVREAVHGYGTKLKSIAPEVIVPVPVHRSKQLERGYNQADILAKGIGKQLGIPVLSDLIIRNKKTLPQKTLNDVERLQNLSEAFQLNEKAAICYNGNMNKVLLVDDIYTTGSTVEACTNVLKAYGVAEVYFIVLCIGKGF